MAWYFVDVLLLGLTKFFDHGSDFAGDALMCQVGGCRLVDEAGVEESLIAFCQRTERYDQIAVGERAIGADAFGECEAESEDEFLALVEKLLVDLNGWDFQFGKERLAMVLAQAIVMRGRVFARLLEVRTVVRAVERHLALFAAALGTDFSVDSGAESLFFSLLTDGASQMCFLVGRLFHDKRQAWALPQGAHGD